MEKFIKSKQNVTIRFNKWFSSRGLKVLKYQKDILLKKIPDSLELNKLPTVLAACPAAGKTIMAIYSIESYIMQNPRSRILVLTHGTTVLRTQFYDELIKIKPAFKYSIVTEGKKIAENQSPVIIALPQTLNCLNKLNKYDLVVVDEAHQFYFADMVQNILKKVKPNHQLLLTGTPSSFVAKKFPTIPISVGQLMDYGMVEDLTIEISGSAYNFDFRDYNKLQELKTGIEIKASETNKTLIELFSAVKTSIKGKTLIACKSIEQAKQINKYIQGENYNTAISTHDLDKDSIEISRFKKDKNCQVLIVVYRGILGFNFPELETVIDMTFSQNLNRIFQLLARVIRKHPEGNTKKFIKVAPLNLQEYFNYIMTAVMCLTDIRYYTKYNGKNFVELEIPVKIIKKTGESIYKSNNDNYQFVIYDGLPAISFFKSILRENSKIAYARLQDIQSILTSGVYAAGYWTFEKCKEDARKYNYRSDWCKKCPSAYNAAQKYGWMEECCKHMMRIRRQKGYWTLQQCKKDAFKYSGRTEWQLKSPSGYAIALKNRWIEECCGHMKLKIKSNGYWTFDKCKSDALKYKTATEWYNKSGSAYATACRKGWINKCTQHMIKIKMTK